MKKTEFFKDIKIFLNPKERKQLLIYFIFSIIVPIIELMSLGSLAGLIVFILDTNKFEEIFRVDLNYLKPENFSNIDTIYLILFLVFVVFLVKNVLLIFYFYFEAFIKFNTLANKSAELYKSYLRISYIHFKNLERADIFNNVMVETGRVVQYIFSFITLFREIFLILLIFISIIYVDPKYSLILFFSLIFISLILYFLLNKKLNLVGERLRIVTKKVLTVIEETQNMFKIINLQNKKLFFTKKFESSIHERTLNFSKQEIVKKIPRMFLEVFLIVLISMLIIFSTSDRDGIEDLIPFLSIIGVISIRLLPAFSGLNSIISAKEFSLPSFLNYKNVISELNKNASKKIISNYNLDEKIISIDKLSLKNISFKYSDEKNLLENISIDLKKNEIFGIFGKSGSGKSTLIEIISGLIEPNSGEIIINEKIKLNDQLDYVQSRIGYVPQETILMNDTLINNICLGLENEEIDHSSLNNVLNITELKEVVYNFKDNINTKIGDSGIKFSGGQRQRIAIARALYLNPEVIILDEATSALDKNAEDKILKIIQNLKDKIIVIISHDLNLKKICNKFIEL